MEENMPKQFEKKRQEQRASRATNQAHHKTNPTTRNKSNINRESIRRSSIEETEKLDKTEKRPLREAREKRKSAPVYLRDEFEEMLLEAENEPEIEYINTSGRNQRKTRSIKNRKKKNLNWIFAVIAVLAVLTFMGVVVGVLYEQRYGLSDEEMSADKYYNLSSGDDLVVILDEEIIGIQGMVYNGATYLPYDFIIENLNSRFYWDTNANNLLYTLENGTVVASLGDSSYEQSNQNIETNYQIIKTVGQSVYVAVEYVELFTDISYETYEEPYRLVITSEWGAVDIFTAKNDTQVRYQAGVKSPIISHITAGDQLFSMDEVIDGWTKVCTLDGFIGYVQTKNLNEMEELVRSSDFEEQVYTNISLDYTINMVWHQVGSQQANDTLLTSIADTSGLTTIAPTWFFINSTDGEVVSYASTTYVNYVHQLGIDVWAVLNDFDGAIGSQAETYEVLSNTEARTQVINSIVAEAIRTGIDGINVDIEHVSTEAGVHYVQFLRELSVKCRQNGLVLSVDNYVPKSYNMHYDFEEQGIIVDYVVIMGYDEYYGGSLEAGPVSSIGYVEDGITSMLSMVSADKIISGIPFYCRLWEETDKTEEELAAQEGTQEGEYLTNVSSTAYGMPNAQNLVNNVGAEAVWDTELMLYFATWESGDTTYKIWLEDVTSIEAKLELMQQYNLAGTAAWKLTLEDSAVWAVIEKYVN